ncbi:MAG TPA: hypothetical protein VG496_16695, partial [Myxococcales bacterium]|nr:hypothetical protein [Myxococcales bacterium]
QRCDTVVARPQQRGANPHSEKDARSVHRDAACFAIPSHGWRTRQRISGDRRRSDEGSKEHTRTVALRRE